MIAIDITTIVSCVSAGLSAAAVTGLFFMARLVAQLRGRCLSAEASLASVRREVELMASISAKTGTRVNRMEHEYSGVADRVDLATQRAPSQSFDQAIDSARRGSDSTQLAQQFGLSRGEAELVARLHGRQRSA
jgi:Protein of unknown function (DUF2802)